jgi:taurine dioxygenase
MHVEPLLPFGARVRGLDADRLAPERDRIAALLREHALVVFERTSFTVDQQIELVGFVGPLLDEGMHGAFHTHIRHDPEIAPAIPAEGVFVGKLSFHSDLTYTSTPPEVLSLHALELPSSGSETRFANGARALAALPASLRHRIDGRHARHVFDAGIDEYGGRYREADLSSRHFAAEHPIVRRNERTGRDVLFVNELLTDRILGLTPDESDELLEALFASLYGEGNVYVHRWKPHDLVVWENHEVQHARPEFDRAQRRILRRVIAGDAVANERHGAEFHAQLQHQPGGVATL